MITKKRTRLKCDNFETLVYLQELCYRLHTRAMLLWPKWQARKIFEAVLLPLHTLHSE